MPRAHLPQLTWLSPRRVRVLASVLVATLAASSLVYFAYLSKGNPPNKVDLNDAGIWVTNDENGLFGRLNKSAASLDAYFNPSGGVQAAYALDITQDQGTVLAWDRAGSKLTPVDVASAKLVTDNAVPLPATTILDMRGGTIAALDPVSGKIWASRYDTASTAPPSLTDLNGSAKPIAEVSPAEGAQVKEGGRFSAIVVDASGAVHAADITGTSVTIPAKGTGFGKPVTTEVAKRESVDLTAVGGHVVFLDVIAGTLSVDDQKPTKRAEVVAGARPQVPSVNADEVLVAAPKALYGFSISTPQAAPRLINDSGAGEPAAPVRVRDRVNSRDCVYAAWSGSPGTVVRGCGVAKAEPLGVKNAAPVLTRPVFRVNRSQVVVNDAANGQVYDLESLERVDNWDKVQDAATDQTVVDEQLVQQEKEKPKANPDQLGARPGRTTILHVLDNDTDKGGRILSISAVTQPGNPNASVSIAPDGQTLIYRLNDQGGDSDFTYQLSNGVADEKGDVRVEDRGMTQNEPPSLRQGATDPTLTVASGGTLPIQVLDQWRDRDGDPVALAGASVPSGTTNLTSDGRIELTAAATSDTAQAKVTYQVSDGRSEAIAHDLTVGVLGSNEIKASPAVTQPDVGRGEVGRPILVTPLLNDIPGADPLNPKAVMKLAGPVPTKEGLDVQTDLVSGQVSITGSQPGHFFLEYAAAFGSAAVTPGAVRVDIDPVHEDSRSPIAVPDQAVVRGTGSVLVDVLSNDSDPLGSVLTVQSATAADPSQLKVAVVSGHWLKLTPSTAALSVEATMVTYRLSNGVSEPAAGVVSVTQLPTASPDQILTRPDYATVRSGDATTIRVLENDAALSGATLSLLGNVPGTKAPGQLKVYNPGATDATAGDLGRAYVSGEAVRYVAPQGLKAQLKLMIEYVAQTEAGDPATGRVEVTVTPEPSEAMTNQAPAPRPVEARAVSGETVIVPIDPTNADPDGDSTSVIGIGSAPKLGRIIGLAPTGITYQAYPDESAQGTDTFTYVVTDRFGATASSTVRVGVTPPTAPQLAVPAPLSITASPDAKVTLYPLLSSSFGKTDPVTLLPLEQFGKDLPEGAKIDDKTQAISAVAGSAKDRPVQFSYGLKGNAGDSAPSTVTVFAVDGFKNPPRLQDTTVKPDGTGHATVDVLATAYDPDGDAGRLIVSHVGLSTATINGGKVTVPVGKNVQAVPFEVTDESGATSAAVIYVPSEGSGGPYLRAGKTITVEEGKSITVPVSDYVEDPQQKPVSLTLIDLITAGPSGQVTASAPSGTELTVTGAPGYIGPGAVVAEFTNGKTLDDPEGVKTFVSIPVQVGPETPVLRCPSDVIPVTRGGKEVSRDVTSLCSVWSPTKEMADKLTFEGSMQQPLDGVSIRNGRALVIDASSDATPGQATDVAVTASGTKAKPSTLHVVVVEAPLATLSPITLPEMKAGEARQVDLTSYFSSPLKDPKPHAISITQPVGVSAQSSVNGMTASITPSAKAHGHMEFQVEMSDVTEKGPADQARRVKGTISFDVFTNPDAPGQPQLQATMMSRSVTLNWPVPPSNGAPILGYEVTWSGGRQACSSTPCTIPGLTNGQDYTFQVRAQNKAGWSDFSPSVTTTQANRPNAQPLAVVATQTAAGDGSATLTWPSAQGEGSTITDYILAYNGNTQPVGNVLSKTLVGLLNGDPVQVTVQARNNSTSGPTSTTTVYAVGTPIVAAPTASQSNPAAASDQATMLVTSASPEWQGPNTAVTYSYFRSGTPIGCPSAPTCIDTVPMAQPVTYQVQVTTTFLGVTRTSQRSASSTNKPPYGTPSTPAVTLRPASEPDKLTFDVAVGQPRAADGFSWIHWSLSGGGTGSFPCGCAAGATVPISVSTTNYTEQTVTVFTDTPLEVQSPRVTSNSQSAFGAPKIIKKTAEGDQAGVKFTWDVDWSGGGVGSVSTSGTPLTNSSARIDTACEQSATITVTATSAKGAKGSDTWSGQAAACPPKPNPVVTPFDTKELVTSGGGCTTTSDCRKVGARVSGFGGLASCNVTDPADTGYIKWWVPDGGSAPSYNFVSHVSYAVLTVTCTGPNGTASGSIPW